MRSTANFIFDTQVYFLSFNTMILLSFCNFLGKNFNYLQLKFDMKKRTANLPNTVLNFCDLQILHVAM